MKIHPHIILVLATASALPFAKAEAPLSDYASRSTAAEDADYRITPGDVVQIKIFREEDLQTTARVTEDGSIGFPLIGKVQLAGKTNSEAARTLHDLLDARFLVNPSVTVSVTGHGKRTFTVLGQVQKPGVYSMTYRDRIDILQAFGMAGGYTRFANSSKVVVKRKIEGRENVFTLNAVKMADHNNVETFQILPGDTITVPESKF